ncbi:MAG: SH3 domain-containing protein [Pseudomonadota bacterium]
MVGLNLGVFRVPVVCSKPSNGSINKLSGGTLSGPSISIILAVNSRLQVYGFESRAIDRITRDAVRGCVFSLHSWLTLQNTVYRRSDAPALWINQAALVFKRLTHELENRIMKRLSSAIMATAALCCLYTLSPISSVAQAACVINVAANDVLNVRSGPSTRNPIIGILSPDRCGVRIVQRSGNWAYVTWRNRRGQLGQGWASLRFLADNRIPSPSVACVTNVAFNDVLNIRAAATSQSRIVGAIPPNGCGVRVIAQNGAWTRIRYNGVLGWVNNRFLSF